MTPKPKPKCPTCGKPAIKKDNAFFPFCSEQCQLIDLGHWLAGGYSIPGTDSPSAPDDDHPENN
ncbi:MAG: DNA gyrase inhibitor YacG [Nitrospinota bacterium]|nr:DNA gyrase inhibitor YacG [Nitrospinota bacterium]